MILLNLGLIFLLLIIVFSFYQRLINRIRKNFDQLPSDNFFENLFRVVIDSFFGTGLDGHFQILKNRFHRGQWNIRAFHFGLAVNNFSVFFSELLVLGSVYHLSREGTFTGITKGLEANYSEFLLSLVPTSSGVILFWLSLGFFFGLVFKSRYISLFLGLMLVFSFFIAIPHFILLVMGEKLGIYIRQVVTTPEKTSRQSFFILLGCLGLTLVIFLTFGGYLRMLVETIALEGNRPGYRILQAFLLFKLVQCIETVITLGVFHFYSKAKQT
jgi:hypothetical protein